MARVIRLALVPFLSVLGFAAYLAVVEGIINRHAVAPQTQELTR